MRVGQPVRARSRDPRGDLLAFALLALDRRERRLQRVRRRLAVASLALLVEIHRRRVQQHRHRRRLRGRRRARRSTRARVRRSRIRRRRSPPTGTSGSSSAASFWPSVSSVARADGDAKRSSTVPALILSRLPDAASTCSDASLSARTDPAFSWPSSSNRTFIVEAGAQSAPERSVGWTGVAQIIPAGVADCGKRAVPA